MSVSIAEHRCPMMMNMSLSAATASRAHTGGGGILCTPPLRRRKNSPASSGFTIRDARSPSPAAFPEHILRQKNTATSKSSHNLCSNIQKISSPAQGLASQFSAISLSTGTSSLEVSPALKPVCPDSLAERLKSLPQDLDSPDFFVLDCRSFISYNLKKITYALNVCCTDRCSRRRLTSGKSSILDMVKGTDKEKESFRSNLKKVDIILYDDNTQAIDDLKDSNNTLQLVGKVLQMQGANVMYLRGGIEEFQKKFAGLCSECAKPSRVPLYSPTTPLIQEPAIDTATASQILPFLFLGNERDAANEERLEELGVTHVLNVTAHIPFFCEQGKRTLTCKRLPASDSGQQNLRQYFRDAFTFIDQVRSASGRVLIHCQAGVSRSATITIAYLMTHTRLSMHEAFRFVKSRRPIVSPNFNFMGQLYSLEQAIEQGQEERNVDLTLEGNIPVVEQATPSSPPPTAAVLPTSTSCSSSLSQACTEQGFRF